MEALDTTNASEHRPVNLALGILDLERSGSDDVRVQRDEWDIGPVDKFGEARVQRELIRVLGLFGESLGLFLVRNAFDPSASEALKFVSNRLEV